MSKVLKALVADPRNKGILERARKRDQRWGSGDVRDFGLFVIDETRKADRAARAAAEAKAAQIGPVLPRLRLPR